MTTWAGERKAALSRETLEEIVWRIVQVARPGRIILFGSAARREMGPHSDIDLLVIKSGEFDPNRLTGDIYVNLHGVGQAVDVILVTPEQVERYRHTHCLVIAPALWEGRRSTVPERYPPDDPREWLNRAKSNLLMARARRAGYLSGSWVA